VRSSLSNGGFPGSSLGTRGCSRTISGHARFDAQSRSPLRVLLGLQGAGRRFFNPDGVAGRWHPHCFRSKDNATRRTGTISRRVWICLEYGQTRQRDSADLAPLIPFSIYDSRPRSSPPWTCLPYTFARRSCSLSDQVPTTVRNPEQDSARRGGSQLRNDDPHIRSPYNFQWTLDYQRLLANAWCSKRYVATRAKKTKMRHYYNQLTG